MVVWRPEVSLVRDRSDESLVSAASHITERSNGAAPYARQERTVHPAPPIGLVLMDQGPAPHYLHARRHR